MDEFLAVLKPAIDKAVADTVRTFLNNPSQFHGDTGIMHYFYHRMMTYGNDLLFKQSANGVRSLLLQSEQYTTKKYRNRGMEDSGGRLDFAVIDPEAVPSDGQVPDTLPPLIGFEVGRNKAVDKMGACLADRDAENVRPGDAAKLIRELRFGKMKAGYLLEFYTDRTKRGNADHVFQTVVTACNDLGLRGMNVISVVCCEPNHGHVSVFPVEWRERLQLGDLPPTPPDGNGGSGEDRDKPKPPFEPQPGDICQLPNGRRVVVVLPGTSNHRYRFLSDDGTVNPTSESFLAKTAELHPTGEPRYQGPTKPLLGEHYLYQNREVIVVNGGRGENCTVRWADGNEASFTVPDHHLAAMG